VRGVSRLAWDLRNRDHLIVSHATITRCKQAMQAVQHPPVPPPVWRFYERHPPHSLWHGDFMEKVVLSDSGQRAYQLTLLDDYSRAYVFCDLCIAQTLCITLQALMTAMRHWQVLPTALLFDNGSHCKGTMLRVFCQRLGMKLI
jgi:transposase InsO family protein